MPLLRLAYDRHNVFFGIVFWAYALLCTLPKLQSARACERLSQSGHRSLELGKGGTMNEQMLLDRMAQMIRVGFVNARQPQFGARF